MSAKRFISPGTMIVLLAISLIASSCASLGPPALETGQAVEADVRADLQQKELQGDTPPESVDAALSVVGQVITVVGQALAPYCGVH
jgi:hypothetical protein